MNNNVTKIDTLRPLC